MEYKLVPGFTLRERIRPSDKGNYISAIYLNGVRVWQDYQWMGWNTEELAIKRANSILEGAMNKLFGEYADPPDDHH